MNRKKKIIYLSIFVVIFFSLFITTPKILSAFPLGKKTICFYLEKKLHAKVTFSTISLSFFGKQNIKNFEIHNEKYTFISNDLSLNQSLLSLLLYKKIKDINIEDFFFKKNLRLKTTQIQKTNNRDIFSVLDEINTITLSQGTIVLQNVDVFQESSFQEVFFSKSKNKILSSGKIFNDNNQGHFFIDITIQPLMNISANILNLPINLLFSQEQDKNIFLEPEYINATFSTQENVLTGNIQSKNIEGFIKGYLENASIVFKEPHSYILLKNELPIYFFNKNLKEYIKIEEKNIDIYSYVKEGVVSLKNIKNSTFNIISEVKSLKLSTKDNKSFFLKDLKIKNIKTQFSSCSSYLEGLISYKDTNSKFNISITNLLFSEEEKNILINHLSLPENLISEFFPEPIKKFSSPMNIITITGKLQFLKKLLTGNIDIQASNLSAKGKIFYKSCMYKLNLSGFYIPSQNFSSYVHNIPKINFDISGELSKNDNYSLNLLGKIFSERFFINAKTKIHSLNKKIKTNEINLVIQGKFDNILCKISSFPLLNIDNGYLDFQFNGQNNSLIGSSLLEISAVDVNKSTPPFLLSLEKFCIDNLVSEEIINYHNFQSYFRGKIENFSTELLEAFYLIPFSLSSVIGKNSFINFHGNISEKTDTFISLESSINTQNLSINNQWFFNKSLEITADSKSHIELSLTPKNYENLINKFSISPDCLLHEKTLLVMDLQPSHNFDEKQLEGSISSQSLRFQSKTSKKEITIQDIVGNLKVNLKNKSLIYELKGLIQENSFIKLGGLIKHPFQDNSLYNGKATLKKLPSFFSLGMLPIPLSLKESLEHLSGITMTQLFEWNIQNHNGTFSCHFDSPNIQAKIPLEIHNKFITLADTANFHLFLNKSFIDILMKDFSLFTLRENKSLPVSLVIEKTNVFIPIHPYEFKDVIVGSAYLDLGRIQIVKDDKINQLFDFLKLQDNSSLMDAWFTPIYFNLKNGVISYKRFDLLINEILHLALWGKTNLLNNYINLTLGIETSRLEKILKVTNLPKNSFFLVKIYGPIDNPSIDWSSAYSRLGILSAASSGGHLGNLFGSVLDKFLSALGGQTPPPTTKPFPWEENK